MTIQDLLDVLGGRPWLLFAVFAGIPAFTWFYGAVLGEDRADESPWKYGYTLLVYAVCLAGIPSVLLVGYALWIYNQNLLEVNALIYFVPPVSMIVTLALAKQTVDFDEIPGFDRLAGLMLMVAISFGIVLAIRKTFIGIFFFGSLGKLFILIGGIVALLEWATHAAFRKRGEPLRERPEFPKLDL